MDLPLDFRDLLEELARAGVEYAIVGGYAVAFHGRPRATKDIDIVLRGDAENLGRAAAALDAFGAAPHIVRSLRGMAENEIVYMGQPPMRVDFLRAIAGVETDVLFENAVEAELDGVPVRIIGLDELISNKRAVGRPRDLEDAELLERVRQRAAER